GSNPVLPTIPRPRSDKGLGLFSSLPAMPRPSGSHPPAASGDRRNLRSHLRHRRPAGAGTPAGRSHFRRRTTVVGGESLISTPLIATASRVSGHGRPSSNSSSASGSNSKLPPVSWYIS